MQEVDFLIVGQGLAGTLFAHHALQQGHPILVLNDETTMASSMVAAGMFTPVNPKRMSVAWMYEQLYATLQQTYAQLEAQTEARFFYHMPIYNVIASAKESNDFSEKMSNPSFTGYVHQETQHGLPVKQEFGGFSINQSGWVDIPVLIESFRNVLRKMNAYQAHLFDSSKLTEQSDGICYENIKAKYVVSCVGHQLHQTGLFGKHKGTKGDTLIISSKSLPKDWILKKGIYMVPLLDNRFKVGATYNRNFDNAQPQPQDAEELMQKLANLTEVETSVLTHQTAIRPTTPDRKPVLGKWRDHNRVYVFNGLGTKGVTYGPFFARHLFNHIIHNDALMPEVDIKRFYR